jgi:rhomboid family GlyGly-CTERM serine protease
MSISTLRGGHRAVIHPSYFRIITDAPLTCFLSLAAIVIGFWPSLGQSLQLEHSAVAAGQWWRLFTAHLTHWSGEHLFWDLMMFVLLGMIAERRSRFAYAICLTVAAVAISLAMLWTSPLSYRGLSGLATTSFAFLAAGMLREQIAAGNGWGTAILAGLIIGLALKIGYEFWSGQCILVSAAGSFTPAPLSHVLGALAGAMVGGWRTQGQTLLQFPAPGTNIGGT